MKRLRPKEESIKCCLISGSDARSWGGAQITGGGVFQYACTVSALSVNAGIASSKIRKAIIKTCLFHTDGCTDVICKAQQTVLSKKQFHTFAGRRKSNQFQEF